MNERWVYGNGWCMLILDGPAPWTGAPGIPAGIPATTKDGGTVGVEIDTSNAVVTVHHQGRSYRLK